MSLSLHDARAKLISHFAGDSASEPSRWSALWDDGSFLPWDRGESNPALIDVLTDRQDLIGNCMIKTRDGEQQRKQALVPGCGRGYDVLLLASFGYDAFGLEVSESAIQRCLEEQNTSSTKYPVRDEAAGAGKAGFIQGDFFSNDWINRTGVDKFDLIYDYTFLSALPPTSRPQWASRMAELLKIDGCLVCVEFPSKKDPKLGGPPYALPPPVYVQHLGHPGQDVPYQENGQVKEETGLQPNPAGLERITHFQPERTHEVGKGQDWVSIWKH